MLNENLLTNSDVVKAMMSYGVKPSLILDYDVKEEVKKFVEDGVYDRSLSIRENWALFCQYIALRLVKGEVTRKRNIA